MVQAVYRQHLQVGDGGTGDGVSFLIDVVIVDLERIRYESVVRCMGRM